MDIRKCYVEIDGQRYPRDSVLLIYEENDYNQENKVLNYFPKLYWRTDIKPSYIISGHKNKISYWNNRFKTSDWSLNT